MNATLLLLLFVPAGSPTESPDFARDIKPIFEAKCVECHGPSKQRGGLRLDRKSDALNGGDSGLAIHLKQPKESLVLKRVSAKDGPERMPPKGESLTPEQISKLTKWIETGATWPEDLVSKESLTHWSFEPIRRPSLPEELKKLAIDELVKQRLAKEGLKLSATADRRTLIRRLTFDLLGLPPTPEQIREFENDRSESAYEKLVERLLACPQFGERQARQWLDVVRFAESNGFEMNQTRPNAYHYRDYVIRSFNEDKPYDRFVKEQLAGDVLGVDEGTGFLVAGSWDQVKSPDLVLTAQQRADELHDMVSTIGSAFLGLSVGCARCHSHKFDPISQVDYHAVKAVFAGVEHGERPIRRGQSMIAADDAIAKVPGEPLPKTLRPGVKPGLNIDRFAPVSARFVRFEIFKTTDAQPCIDELEVFTVGDSPRNVALASEGGKVTVSSTYPGNKFHQVNHLIDGRYGNEYSWISNEPNSGTVTLELTRETVIDRVKWSRDRSPQATFKDRVPTQYRIQVSSDGKTWKPVADHTDRGQSSGGINAYVGRMVPNPPGVQRLHRGDVTQPKEWVNPGVLSSLGPKKSIPEKSSDGERRLAFADWVVDPSNPLTARVIVNRIWQQHFGTGFVDTPSDFGRNGAKPTNPELLDWLASELIAHGWSLKHIHRLIVNSKVYQQDSRLDTSSYAKDAQTRLLWRFPPQRLQAESIRDAILSVTGRLDLTMGGPGFDLFQPNSNYVKVYTPKTEFGPDTFRRMIYQSKPRMQLDDTFGAFDCPDGGQIAPKRSSSTTPLQSLNLLNSPFLLQQSQFFADRLVKEAGAETTKQINLGFQYAFGRESTSEEMQAAQQLIAKYGLAAFCRALLNANEFVFVR